MNEQIQKIVQEVYEELCYWKMVLEFLDTPYDKLIVYHHTIGTVIRNKYELWSIPWTPEIKDGCDCSPYHPDQVSMTIIEEVWKLGQRKRTTNDNILS